MKRLVLAGASLGVFASTLAGCYWLVSYQDLTSGNAETGEAGATPDGQTDAGAPPVDATTIVDATPPAFCQGEAGPNGYCMDFDGVDAYALGLGISTASAAIASNTWVSPPSSMRVKLFGLGSYAAYNVPFPIKPTKATLEFEILPVTVSNVWTTTLAISLYDDSTQTGRNLNVVVTNQAAYQVQEYFSLGDGGSAQNGHDDPPPDGGGADAGGWHHVVLTLDLGQSTSGLTVDGQVLEANQPLGLPWATGSASISVGVTYGGGSGPEFYFDNVRATFL